MWEKSFFTKLDVLLQYLSGWGDAAENQEKSQSTYSCGEKGGAEPTI
jgi:hypothetical protein